MSTPTLDPAAPATSAQETLHTPLTAVQELSLVRRLEDVQAIVRTAARRLVRADGATFVLRDNDKCFYPDEDAISPLWKGEQFPLEACISGWAMLNRSTVAIENIYADDRIPHDAYRPTFVKSLVMVPIRTMDPLGSIGMYWAHNHRASEAEVMVARALADSTAVALEHVQVLGELERTVELSQTDVLTGLPNRRAWDAVLEGALRPPAGAVTVALIDLDHFKSFNDTHGHQAGDEFLRRTADAWRASLRAEDVVARFGGEEFAALIPAGDRDRALRVAERLRRAVPDGETASIGVARWDGRESATSLIERADVALYQAKSSGRDRVVHSD